jgi:hypothetical protein
VKKNRTTDTATVRVTSSFTSARCSMLIMCKHGASSTTTPATGFQDSFEGGSSCRGRGEGGKGRDTDRGQLDNTLGNDVAPRAMRA